MMAAKHTRLLYSIFYLFFISSIAVTVFSQVDHTPLPPQENLKYQDVPRPPADLKPGFDFGSVESLHPSDDFEGLPGVQHEFRVEVAAGRAECFYQRLMEGAQIHVSYQVLRGSDLQIGFTIRGSNTILSNIEWSSNEQLQHIVPSEGLYQFCLNNELSQFSSKLVHFYMMSYSEEKWHKHSQNVLDFYEGTDDIRKSLDLVNERLKLASVNQAVNVQTVIADWYLLRSNLSYVQNMSIIFCVVIVVSSAFQVYFVRRLFSSRTVVSKSKPRA